MLIRLLPRMQAKSASALPFHVAAEDPVLARDSLLPCVTPPSTTWQLAETGWAALAGSEMESRTL